MKQNSQDLQFSTPPASIYQWQWEDSVEVLRRQTPEAILGRHWTTTGVTSVDATARAHIAEWFAIDVNPCREQAPETIVDALIHRALFCEPWDLYIVEGHDSSSVSVRRLSDHSGHRIQWLEGRQPPELHSTVAMRLIRLDPPGLNASTLPIVFGNDSGLVRALLCSHGAHKLPTWKEFMSGPGARIVLEYGLSYLLDSVEEQELTDLDTLRDAAIKEFETLERIVELAPQAVSREVLFEDGQIGWIEDILDGPRLMIFSCRDDFRRYRRSMISTGHRKNSSGGVSCCRVYRQKRLRIYRRDSSGHLTDPRASDYKNIVSICQRMVPARRDCAA